MCIHHTERIAGAGGVIRLLLVIPHDFVTRQRVVDINVRKWTAGHIPGQRFAAGGQLDLFCVLLCCLSIGFG